MKLNSTNQYNLSPCPVALSRRGSLGVRALSSMFELLRKVSVVSVLAFAVALGFTAQAGAQEFEMEGGFIVEPVGPAGGARGSTVTYRVYADLLTRSNCITDGDPQCAFNVLSVVMNWDFGDFALESCEEDVDAAGDCAADGQLTDDSARDIPESGGSDMKRYYQVGQIVGGSEVGPPDAVLGGGKIRLLQVDADDNTKAQEIYDSVILNSNVLPDGTGETTLTVIILNSPALIPCAMEDDLINSCDKFALFEVTLYVLGAEGQAAGEVLEADIAASLASPTPSTSTGSMMDQVTGAGFYTPSMLTATLRDVQTVAIEFDDLLGVGLDPADIRSAANAVEVSQLTIMDQAGSDASLDDRLKLRLNELVITQTAGLAYLGVRLFYDGTEITATGDDATATVVFDVSGIDFAAEQELTVSLYAKEDTVYTSGVIYNMGSAYRVRPFSSVIADDSNEAFPTGPALEFAGDRVQFSVLADSINIAAIAGETTQVFIARTDDVPKMLEYTLRLTDEFGNVDPDFAVPAGATHVITVDDGEGIVSALDPAAAAFNFWPSTDNAGVTFSITNVQNTQGDNTLYSASAPQTVPFNVEASRLVASGDPGIELLDSASGGTSATVTQTLQAVAGPADCSTNEMLPCVVDTDFPGDALVAAVLTDGFSQGLNNPSISLDPAEINFVDGQAVASLMVDGGALSEDTTPAVSITFSVAHSIYGDIDGVAVVFNLEDTAFDLDIDGNGVTTQLVDYAILFAWAFNLNTYRVGTMAAGGDPTDPMNVNLSVAAQALGSPIAQGWLDSSIPIGEPRSLEEAVQKLVRILPPIPMEEQENHPRYEAIDIDGNGVTSQLVDYAMMFAWAFNLGTYRAGTLAAGGDPTDPLNINLSVAAQALGSPIAQGWVRIDDGTLEAAAAKLVRILPPVEQ